MADAVQQLVAQGYLSQGNGYYDALLDFYFSWAQINWYQWRYTGQSPTDFVIRADIAWESGSDTANWFSSGCGFVFREASTETVDHYLAYLGLDGVVYFTRQHFDEYYDLGSDRYGRLEVPNGSAQIMLAVEGDKFSFFVNDEHVITATDSHLATGRLNYTLLSGTNKRFGTRCEMTHVGLWTLEP
jgi:hypothetical protein